VFGFVGGLWRCSFNKQTSHIKPHTPHTSRTPIEAYASFSDICGAWVGFGSEFGIGFTLLLTRSSPSRHPPFTQYPSPSRSLVRDGQTSPHKPGLVVPHSTCPSLSPSPPARSFIIGPAVINTRTHLHLSLSSRDKLFYHQDCTCVSLRSAKQMAIDNNTLTIRTFLFSPPL
jgi:hypothetical protein